jgi:microcystin-dependent protein
MACIECGSAHTPDKCPIVNFRLDGTILVPYLSGVPGDGVDLQHSINEGQTNTRLQLDLESGRLVYTGEQAATGSAAPDYLSIGSIASLMNLEDLQNVATSVNSDGDVLAYDAATAVWQPYTVPLGNIISLVGIDVDGKLVKSGSSGDSGDGAAGGASIPIGGGLVWPGAETTIPDGFVRQDGRELSRTVYASLFGIIGTTYGAGNGTTTFNIPNTSGRAVVGQKTSDGGRFSTLGAVHGSETVSLSLDQMPRHTHSYHDPGHHHGMGNIVYSSVRSNNSTYYPAGDFHRITWSGRYTYHSGVGISIYHNGGSQAHDNLQPSIAQLYIMRII